jgi:hypothetical protein
MMKDQEYKDKLAVFYWQPRVVPETKKQFCVGHKRLQAQTQNKPESFLLVLAISSSITCLIKGEFILSRLICLLIKSLSSLLSYSNIAIKNSQEEIANTNNRQQAYEEEMQRQDRLHNNNWK